MELPPQFPISPFVYSDKTHPKPPVYTATVAPPAHVITCTGPEDLVRYVYHSPGAISKYAAPQSTPNS